MDRVGKSTLSSSKKGVPAKFKLPTLVLIPGGEGVIGISDEQVEHLVIYEEDWALEWYDKDMFLSEQPQHTLFLPAYEIGKHPVTNAEYYHFIWETGYRVPRGWIGFHYGESLADHPVVDVSWKDAQAYCQWLTKKAGKTLVGGPYRLPTEAEWEHASRGNDERLYPWGDDFDPWRCNTVESGKRGTTALGEYSPSGDSPFGLMDMSGNVWEWTSSRLEPYPYDPEDGREDMNGQGKFVIRGGAWYYSHKLARCTTREGAQPNFISPSLGFRVAHTPG